MAKWIRFEDQMMANRKTKVFAVINKDTGKVIGTVSWYAPFRQYSYFPADNTVYERTCLRDIVEFIEKLMEEHKKKQDGKV
jgi:hypothetical protein